MKRRRIIILTLAIALLPLSAGAEDSSPPPDFAQPTQQYAQGILGQTQELALRAMSFIGVRYKWGGDSPDTGFDCSGLIRYVYAQITGQSLQGNAEEISRAGRSVDKPDLQPGDLVFFNTLRKPFSHVGIYMGESRFLHAPSRGGAVEIVDMTQRYWRSRYNGARRLPI